MIKIKVLKDGSSIKRIVVTGHAKYDDFGKDIVCASVSSVVITSCNMALKLDNTAVKVTEKEGFIEVIILKDDKTINKVFENMLDMLKELEEQYDKNVKIV